jgi:hypothetical protein
MKRRASLPSRLGLPANLIYAHSLIDLASNNFMKIQIKTQSMRQTALSPKLCNARNPYLVMLQIPRADEKARAGFIHIEWPPPAALRIFQPRVTSKYDATLIMRM